MKLAGAPSPSLRTLRKERSVEVAAGPRGEPTFVTRYRRVLGHKLHWTEMGEGPPLVLLHGLCDSHRTWLKAAPLLARNHRVLMLDLAGHGLSDRPDASYRLEWHARLLGLWMDALALENVDVVGHSYGGGVALWMTLLRHGDRVRKLGLVASGGLGKEVAFALRLASLPLFVEHFGQPFLPRATRLGMRVVAHKAFDGDEVTRLAVMNATAGTARAIARTVRDVVSIRGQQRHVLDKQDELGRLPPVGLFWGDRDPVIPISHALQMQETLGGAALVRFERCGHFPHRERAPEFAAAVEKYLAVPRSDARSQAAA